ncbi:hypothetical protein LguiB_013882 [Lonicera macranthoides]
MVEKSESRIVKGLNIETETVSANLVVGSRVWVEDPEVAWIDGEILEVNGQEIKISSSSGKVVVANVSNVFPKDCDAPSCGVDDMTKLAYLHEPGVLQNLRSRFDMNEIYTYTGSILIAVNPFQRLPHLYDKHMMEQYKGAAFGELSPHPFAIADAAYRQSMINEGISQAILVSGESGAGKTESTKMLMRYLAYMGGKSASEERSVEQQVLESNPVLEAFGNAKTVRNNNSSRFGKFVEIQFDQRGRISGAAVRTYLLERSRVCQVSDPERNYHCFYMLCDAPPEETERYKLGDAKKFHYLNQSNCYKLDGVDESKEYLATKKAMGIVGISSDEQEAIFRVVAAILHLGNVEFAKGSEPDSSEPKDDQSRFHLKTVAEHFMLSNYAAHHQYRPLTTAVHQVSNGAWMGSPVTGGGAAAVIRFKRKKMKMQEGYFRIVNKINNSIGQDPDSKSLIGVLDIYGFESFKTNRCLSGTLLLSSLTEVYFLQSTAWKSQHVFKMEQEEYTKEEINWSYIEFIDNQDILDLIEKKPGGIIALLDEACMFPRSTHETFATKLYQTFKDHKRFSKPKLARTDFTICHYAGDVTYQTELFLDKNKDYVVAEHQALLSDSKCSFVSGLFPPSPEESSQKSKFSSIGSRFKQQLQALLETLSATEPHYIRCVKPNNLLKPGIFENHNILQQLRCGGVMEAIRISCAGFPTRKTFDEFIGRFGILAPDVLNGSYDEVNASKMILEKVNLKDYQIGKTKVFLRAGQMAELDAHRIEILGRSASIIQRKVRSYYARKSFVSLKFSAIQIQAFCRGQVAWHCYERMRREAACLRIQREARMYISRKAYRMLCISAIYIQTGMRGLAARVELWFRRKTQAAVRIQSQCRQYLAHRHYLRKKKAAIATQCAWRARMARRELRKLKMAAKETGALQAAKSKLEKEVEELTWRLQLEKRMRADMEEAKTKENARLQSAFQEMQLQFQETKELLMKEKEELKKEVQQVPALVSSLETKIDETEKKYEEANKLSEERLKQALEAESKLIQLKTDNQRLEEKLSDMETLEEIRQQQASTSSPAKKMSEQLSSTSNKDLDNGYHSSSLQEPQSTTPKKKLGMESEDNMRKSLVEKQRGFRSSPSSASLSPRGADIVRPVEAKYPALLFKQQLTAYVEKIYGIIRDNTKKELSSLISSCIQAARTSRGNLRSSTRSSGGVSPVTHWQHIIECLNELLYTLKENCVPTILVQNIFSQIFFYINLQLFNSLLLRRECCTFSNGEYVKAGLAELELWCNQAKPECRGECNSPTASSITSNAFFLAAIRDLLKLNVRNENGVLEGDIRDAVALEMVEDFHREGGKERGSMLEVAEDGSSLDELKHLRQAVGFLVIHQKSRISYDDLSSDLCPVLSVQQLYRICTLYRDDNYHTPSVSPDVISSMKVLMTEDSNEADSNSFLLDDSSTASMPFSLEDSCDSIKDKDFSEVKAAAELLENPAFQFLQEQ